MFENEARERLHGRDDNDWPVVASALALGVEFGARMRTSSEPASPLDDKPDRDFSEIGSEIRPVRARLNQAGIPSPRSNLCSSDLIDHLLPRSRQHQRNIVRLLVVADPVVNCGCHRLTDLNQREVTICGHQVNQSFFAEFAKLIFRFGHAVAIGNKDFAGMHLHRTFVISHVVEQADNRSPGLQTPHPAIFANEDRRQMASIAVGQLMRAAVVNAQKQRGIFFRRPCFPLELMIEQAKQCSGRNLDALWPGSHDSARASHGAHRTGPASAASSPRCRRATAEWMVAIKSAAEIPFPLISPTARINLWELAVRKS